ncbi:hypothetical protein Leryth_015632 [Lithospermum erythrorhizon]|nr:hypothetical protein Leryth_015632 [Lithospermum erythrorhizon]
MLKIMTNLLFESLAQFRRRKSLADETSYKGGRNRKWWVLNKCRLLLRATCDGRLSTCIFSLSTLCPEGVRLQEVKEGIIVKILAK